MPDARRTLPAARAVRRLVALSAAVLVAVGLSACSGSNPPPPPPTESVAAPHIVAHPGQVAVYPAPGSRTASPQTQLSFRGVAPGKIGTVSVVGSKSGPHGTDLRADSDGDGASLYLSDPLEPGEQVTVTTDLSIVGASSGTYTFTVATPVADKAGPGDETEDPDDVQTFRSAPSLRPPKLSVTAGKLTDTGGDVFLAPKDGPGQDGPMIVGANGRLVWFLPLAHGERAYDFRVQSYQGQPVLTWWQGYNTDNGHGKGEGVIYNDSYRQVATVKAGNGYQSDLHDFTLTADDTALVTVYQPVRWDTSPIGGSTDGVVLDSIVQEIDIPTGNVLDEWHSLDHVPLNDSYAGVPSGDKAYDYFHINSIDLGPDGNLLISGRATHAVYDVDVATGEIIWQLGGKQSTFTGNGTTFSSQHDAKWRGPHRISVFDNAAGVGKATQKHSRGLLIDLDLSRQVATIESDFTTSSVPRVSSQGNVQPLPDGGALVGWGQQPDITQFAADGSVVFQLKLPGKDQTYRAFRFPWSGHPTTAPAVAARAHAGATSVAVSWNGATAVQSWRVLTGPRPSAVTPAVTAPVSGFETAIPVPGRADYVQVQALGIGGQVLATSAAVAVKG